MSDSTLSLTPREQRFANAMAIRFQSTDHLPEFVNIPDVETEQNETRQDIVNIVSKFVRFNLLAWDSNDSFEILPALLTVSHKLNNQPVPNHLSDLTSWWFSAKWRAVVTVFVIILPLLVQWIEMIQQCLSWILQSTPES